MLGIKDYQKWLDKPIDVLKDVLSKPSRRTHPYIYFGYSPDPCHITGEYVLGNVIEHDYAQHDPQQSFSTITISDTTVAGVIRSTLLSMFPALSTVPPGALHLNNLLSAAKDKSDIRLHTDGSWVVDNPRGDEPTIIYRPAITKHFMDRFLGYATSAKDGILKSEYAFDYSCFEQLTQSGRMALHTLPSHVPIELVTLAKKMTCVNFVGFDLISPTLNKQISPKFVIRHLGDHTYTTGSKYSEVGIEITMSRPYNIIFARRAK